MTKLIKALRNVSFDEPNCAIPRPVDLPQRGVAPSVRAKAVRLIAKLRLKVCLQNLAYDFLHQFIRPDRHP